MSTLHQLREGLNEAWGTLWDGWQRLYRRAAGAITRFTPARHEEESTARDLALRSSGWGVLAAEVFHDDDRVVVRLEAPGLDSADFDVQVLEDCLVVRGEKRIARERTQGRFHVTECAYGCFERAIPLPEAVQSDQAHASYRNGVLRVELPRAAQARRKTIAVQAE